jgi:hypothetical protein
VETRAHKLGKLVAMRALRDAGCAAVAAEVRCPIARFRADAAGYLDAKPKRFAAGVAVGVAGVGDPAVAAAGLAGVIERGELPRTVIVEVKVSRADYLRDAASAAELAARLDGLLQRRAELAGDLAAAAAERDAAGATRSMLFEELEPWERTSGLSVCGPLLDAAIAKLERERATALKLATLCRYHLASYLIMLTPPGLLSAGELAPGWGLVEFDPEADARSDGAMVVRLPPRLHGPTELHRQRLLRNIAAAASAAMLRSAGAELEQRREVDQAAE